MHARAVRISMRVRGESGAVTSGENLDKQGRADALCPPAVAADGRQPRVQGEALCTVTERRLQ